jgi:hypothetical protein
MKNLILMAWPGLLDYRDLVEIANEVVRLAPDIAAHIISPLDTADVLSADKWQRPTLIVSFGLLGKFSPPRGRVLNNSPLTKLEQYQRFKRAGLPCPHIEVFEMGSSYDENTWGEFVVLKPGLRELTSHGRGVHLIRTRRLNELSRGRCRQGPLASSSPILVQQFINTGSLPTYWRALTMFGNTLYCMKFWSPIAMPELTAPDEEIEAAIIEPKHPDIVSRFKQAEIRSLEKDEEVVEFARTVHKVTPLVPLLGIDIVREAGTGKLYVIENNSGGNVWHFSSPRSRLGRTEITREDRIRQFGAWKVAAATLVHKTRELAT